MGFPEGRPRGVPGSHEVGAHESRHAILPPPGPSRISKVGISEAAIRGYRDCCGGSITQ